MEDVAVWLLDWFERYGPIPGENRAEQMAVDYFARGLIDSMGVVELIINIEERFGIHFTQDYFQDRRFSTIGGLHDIIVELLASSEHRS